MKHGRIYLKNDRQLILENVMLTTNPLERMRGLLGRPVLRENQGLLIQPCSSIHTVGMGYPIDVIFLDRNWRVLKLTENLGKFRMAWCRNSAMVLETLAHTIARWRLEPDTELIWEDL